MSVSKFIKPFVRYDMHASSRLVPGAGSIEVQKSEVQKAQGVKKRLAVASLQNGKLTLLFR